MQAGAWGVSVSIDYADAARHDRRRGMDGAWQQAWRAVEMLSPPAVHELAAGQRAGRPDGRQHRRHGAAAGHGRPAQRRTSWSSPTAASRPARPPSPTTTGRSPRGCWTCSGADRNFLSNPYYLARFDRFLHGGVAGCRAGRAFFNIDSTGDIAICVEQQGPARWPTSTATRCGSIRRRLRAAARGNTCTRLLVQLPRRGREPLRRRQPWSRACPRCCSTVAGRRAMGNYRNR